MEWIRVRTALVWTNRRAEHGVVLGDESVVSSELPAAMAFAKSIEGGVLTHYLPPARSPLNGHGPGVRATYRLGSGPNQCVAAVSVATCGGW